jgi:hypothetical protein
LVKFYGFGSAYTHSVRFPSMDQFSIIDKNKGKCCVETKQILLEIHFSVLIFATGPFIALGGHEWTTLFPSMDHVLNIGKCRFTRVVMHYVL